jgi:hypothetical protein
MGYFKKIFRRGNISFKDAVSYQADVAQWQMKINMEQTWNGSDRGKPKRSEQNLSQFPLKNFFFRRRP